MWNDEESVENKEILLEDILVCFLGYLNSQILTGPCVKLKYTSLNKCSLAFSHKIMVKKNGACMVDHIFVIFFKMSLLGTHTNILIHKIILWQRNKTEK